MKFGGSDPIFIQIADYIKHLIDSGVFKEGDILPSVRDFGMANGVNPNTVARAYDLLIERDVIKSIPKKGYFVKEDEKTLKENSLEILEKRIQSLLDEGYTKEDIMNVLNKKGAL